MDFHFILVEPAVPENIGSSARALKTMGFNSLRLVNPCDHLAEMAFRIAHGSSEILKNAKIFSDFDQAIKDLDFLICTTSKKRSVKYDYYSCDELPDIINRKAGVLNNIGIAFGREESGLTNEQIKKADIVSYIPMTSDYPSLNLSQAVMIYAYFLSVSTVMIGDRQSIKPHGSEMSVLRQKVAGILTEINIDSDTNLYNRIMERLGVLGGEDIHLILSVCNKIAERFANKN